eukprot:scaffold64242_cov102-Phaeocystis_antarctica.AAC.2
MHKEESRVDILVCRFNKRLALRAEFTGPAMRTHRSEGLADSAIVPNTRDNSPAFARCDVM